MQLNQVGELESSKSAMNTLRPRVESVDHHLPVDRACDLDAPVGDLVGRRGNAPVTFANVDRLGQEVGQLARAQALEARCPPLEELDSA